MALNNAAADVLANTIVTNLGLTGSQATAALTKWKIVTEAFFASLIANGSVTIEPASIVTTGTATTQAGPPSPIILPLE